MDNSPPPIKNEFPTFAVETENLTKIYAPRSGPTIKALDNINLKVRRGSVFGLLGPNGAGKSTLINMLAGLAIKTSGVAKIWGFDFGQSSLPCVYCSYPAVFSISQVM